MSKRKTKKLHNVKKEKNVFIDEKVIHRRVFVLFIFVVLLFSILFFKLFDVMVLKMDVYKKSLKELSYTIVEGQSAPRGRIYDRNYNLLVDNKAVKTIFYKKDKTISTKKEIELAYKVSSHLNLKYEKLTDRQMREFYLEKDRKSVV